MHSRKLILAVLLCAAIFSAACATTELMGVWVEEGYRAQPKRVLVISLFKDQTVRRMVEDEFRNQLRSRGAEAATGYQLFTGNELPTKEALVEQVKTGGYDSVLLTRLIDLRTEKHIVPGTAYAAPHYGTSMGGYYGQSYAAVYRPSYEVEDKFATVETNLYETATEKLVWTARSDTWLAAPDQKLVKNFVDVVMDALRRQKIVR